MQREDSASLAVYALLGQAFISSEKYDARGAFVLLTRIDELENSSMNNALDKALALHAWAALSEDIYSVNVAKKTLVSVVELLQGISK